ncbi:hypothetical protein XU18_5161 [Perkinsela sp. CCAP 1560/4]|nr:hypothetical protein XU18_5161 [Perkinsela sp. CCAP 1560/4]|eukprot:KNH01793.1 hypothetical protein XU18_5161 [Perkinsela sp. CCAP 1560/4]
MASKHEASEPHEAEPAQKCVKTPLEPYVASSTGREKKLIPTTKAYKNENFLLSYAARQIRVQCEFQEPAARLSQCGVMGTILFFGSARSMSLEDYEDTKSKLQRELMEKSGDDKKGIIARLEKLEKTRWMCDSYETLRELARRLAGWSMNNPALCEKLAQNPPMYGTHMRSDGAVAQPLMICTGGGPGFMEAANRGAHDVPESQSMGMAISLPFEKGVNEYVSPNLAFEFHYFFTRKFWMMYSAKAIVIAPGGYGTFDEMFEMLTLKQTGKVKRIPIVLFGEKYWKNVINWQFMVEMGTISQEDVDELCFTDSVDVAFEFIRKTLEGREPTGLISRSPCE